MGNLINLLQKIWVSSIRAKVFSKSSFLKGKLTHDTEMLGKMSPYITLVFKQQKMKSKIHYEGGKEPIFGDKFSFDITDASEEIVMRVWDKDMTTSDAVGFCKIKITSLIINNGVEDWFDIYFDNKKAGSIQVRSRFEPVGGDQYENMMREHQE